MVNGDEGSVPEPPEPIDYQMILDCASTREDTEAKYRALDSSETEAKALPLCGVSIGEPPLCGDCEADEPRVQSRCAKANCKCGGHDEDPDEVGELNTVIAALQEFCHKVQVQLPRPRRWSLCCGGQYAVPPWRPTMGHVDDLDNKQKAGQMFDPETVTVQPGAVCAHGICRQMSVPLAPWAPIWI